jgi:hypothetical protein
MLRDIGRTVLWKYADDVPLETLHHHHRIVSRITRIGIGAAVLMASSSVEFLISQDGWFRTISFALPMAYTTACAITFIPAFFAVFWAGEVEGTCKARGSPLPKQSEVGPWVGSAAMKMCFWYVVLVLIGLLISSSGR